MSSYPIGVEVENGIELILEKCMIQSAQKAAVDICDKRILAEDILAKENIPPFARSPYDGYALRAQDIENACSNSPVTLSIIEEVPAGHAPTKKVNKGEAVKILTGAPIPEGADVVVMFEKTTYNDTQVTLTESFPSGSNIVPVGEDVKIGNIVVKKGTKLTPALLGILAGLGYSEVSVYKKPVVALISTGDELVNVNEDLKPGKIRNSSVYNIRAILERFGCDTITLGIVKDTAELIKEKVLEGIEKADMVITTGGVSVGDYDMVKEAMRLMNAEVLFWKVKMKPGSAFLAASYKEKIIIGLSGNPSAAAVAAFMLAVPAVKKISGINETSLEKIQIKLKKDFKKKSFVRRFLPGKLEIIDGQAYLDTSAKQGNGMLSPLDCCDTLGSVEAGSDSLKKDDIITAYRIY